MHETFYAHARIDYKASIRTNLNPLKPPAIIIGRENGNGSGITLNLGQLNRALIGKGTPKQLKIFEGTSYWKLYDN